MDGDGDPVEEMAKQQAGEKAHRDADASDGGCDAEDTAEFASAVLVCPDTDEGRSETRAEESGKEEDGNRTLGEAGLLTVERVKSGPCYQFEPIN